MKGIQLTIRPRQGHSLLPRKFQFFLAKQTTTKKAAFWHWTLARNFPASSADIKVQDNLQVHISDEYASNIFFLYCSSWLKFIISADTQNLVWLFLPDPTAPQTATQNVVYPSTSASDSETAKSAFFFFFLKGRSYDHQELSHMEDSSGFSQSSMGIRSFILWKFWAQKKDKNRWNRIVWKWRKRRLGFFLNQGLSFHRGVTKAKPSHWLTRRWSFVLVQNDSLFRLNDWWNIPQKVMITE